MWDEKSHLIDIRAQCITDYAKSKTATGSFTDGVLAVHGCPGNDAWFHLVLHKMFYEQRCRRSGLLVLSLTSKWLHDLVEPLLWSMVELERDKDRRSSRPAKDLLGRTTDRLLLSLMKRRELGFLVRSISFEYTKLMPIGPDDNPLERSSRHFESGTFRPSWRGQSRIQQETNLLDENIELVSYLPHLRSLKLTFKFGMAGTTPYAFSEGFVSRVSALQNLTEVSLTWEVQGYIAFSSLVALFLLPSLRVLYLSDVVCGDEDADDDEDIIPELSEQVKRKSGVKDLTLDFAMMESGPLIALLQLPSALEKFAYSFVSEGIYHRNASAGRFFDLLYPQRNTIKEIDIIGAEMYEAGDRSEASARSRR